MTFDEILEQAIEMLQRRGRVSYGALKRQFAVDDAYLADLKVELVEVLAVAADQDGKMLVWAGEEHGAKSREHGAKNTEEENRKAQRLASAPSSPLPAARAEGERRQLTVMFCDLVGSTTLSAQLDPEELHAVIRAYQEVCAGPIHHFAGHIAQYLGDGLLVYFGYPVAHEDDAARAVRAGLEMLEAIHHLNTRLPHPIQVRIGVHTGPVVVTGVGSGERQELLALGEAPNIAARLQGLAVPDTLVISGVTSRLVHGLFEWENLGPQTLKGIATPVSVYRVLGESEAQSRFEAAVSKGLTPLVGREEELGLLRRRWEQAKEGEGQVVLLSGEPGIGKSRLVQTLKEQVTAEGATRIEFRCSPYHQNSAFYPLIEHLQRLLQFAPQDTPHAKLDKLRQTVAQYRFLQADTLTLFATLLSLPQPAGVPALTLSPQKQKQKTQEALVAWLLEEAERQTVYCVWEDLHWVDPSTLDVLTLLLDQAPTTRLMVLLTFRPDFAPPWRLHSRITQLTLSRLQQPQVTAMVTQVTGGKTLPTEVLRQIIGKTDGVPLFVEELTKMVLESELVRETEDHYELTGVLPPLAIPSTLQDSLMARLDRLSTVREIIQLGAILGREFSYELLHVVSPLDEETLQQGLHQLVEAELIYPHGLSSQVTYIFKHALIQDTAYQSLLKSTRQQYHRQIAQVLEERFPDTTETQPELMAHHYTEAGLVEQAIPYWQQAGQKAVERSANVEAISHFTRGIELLKTLPDTPGRTQQELTLQTALGIPLVLTKGHAAPEVVATYTRARDLCRQVGETPQLFLVLLGLRRFYFMRGELQTAREQGAQLLTLAQRLQDSGLLARAHMMQGEVLYHLGEFVEAREHFEQGVALYDSQQHRSDAFLYGNDTGVACLALVATALSSLGYWDQALKRSQEALTRAQELSQPYSLAIALSAAAHVHHSRWEGQAAQKRAEALIALSTEQGFPFFLAMGVFRQGAALAGQSQGEEGIEQMHRGLVAYQAIGTEVFRPGPLALLAEAYGKVGRTEEGLTLLAESLELVDKTGERSWEAELYRLKGELSLQSRQVKAGQDKSEDTDPRLLTPDPHGEAEACFLKALEVARRQQAKSLELRAATSLARLWQQQGKSTEAHKLLSEIYHWFTEGFDTKDLQGDHVSSLWIIPLLEPTLAVLLLQRAARLLWGGVCRVQKKRLLRLPVR